MDCRVINSLNKMSIIYFAVVCAFLFLVLACSPSSEDPGAVSDEQLEGGSPQSMGLERTGTVGGSESTGPSGSGGAYDNAEPRHRVQKIELDPGIPVTGDRITVHAFVSESHIESAQFVYRWHVNGQIVQESFENVLDHGVYFGDFVEVEAIPYVDGKEGISHRHFFTVANSPPLIRVWAQNFDEDGVYEAILEVSDPEGDGIHIELHKGPEGMVLDADSKALRWVVKPGDIGTFDVQVLGKDDLGNANLLTFQVRVSWVQDQKSDVP